MKLYIVLLVLGLVMVGAGSWVMLKPSTVETFSMSVSPPPGNYLVNSQNVSSEVLLKDIKIETGGSDKQYGYPYFFAGESVWSQHAVNIGDPVLIVSGNIQNKHKENKEIAMYAEGYDTAGTQVAWTLDAAHIAGQIGLHLETGETGEFTLHLNYPENITSIRVFANNYPVTPP